MSTDQSITVRVTRQFSATPERVFDAWLDPEQARQFLFATPTGEMVRVEIDPRVGGTFLIVERRDGEDAPHYGKYLEIDRPRRLVFSMFADEDDTKGSKVVIEIAATDTGCELTLTHALQPQWADYADRTRAGWSGILEGLASVVS